MKLILTLRLFTLFILAPFVSVSQNQSAAIRIAQDQGHMLYDFETTLELSKGPFRIQVLLENVSGVYVFANVGDSVYRFSQTDPIRDFIYLPLLELKDEPYNADKDLNICRTGWSYWFYNATRPHPFDPKVYSLDGDRIVCTKSIKYLYDVVNETQICMDDINGPLYLLFIVVSEYDKDGKPSKELLRRKVKINWKESLYTF